MAENCCKTLYMCFRDALYTYAFFVYHYLLYFLNSVASLGLYRVFCMCVKIFLLTEQKYEKLRRTPRGTSSPATFPLKPARNCLKTRFRGNWKLRPLPRALQLRPRAHAARPSWAPPPPDEWPLIAGRDALCTRPAVELIS